MVVYGHRTFPLEPRRFLSDLHRRLERASGASSRDELSHLVVDVGEAEAGVADALMPDIDADLAELAGWREIAGSVAAAECAHWYDDSESVRASLHRARCAVERVLRQPLPPVVLARSAEGFACYSLFPEQYMAAAEQLLAAMRPGAVFCIGLRSIGSILAHIVGATLQRAGVWALVRSVRPRGHPFDRRVRMDPSLKRLIESSRCDLCAVIDEGPGLSGSSFAAAADELEQLGVPRQRIVLVPAWDADGDRLRSSRGARVWQAHRRFVGEHNPFDGYASREDLSAGRWRALVYPGASQQWPASHPQHERPKFADIHARSVSRFAGLGKFGSRRRERAVAMHAAGFGPKPGDLRNGMLELEWIDGRPATIVSERLLVRAADYLAFVRQECATGIPDSVDELRNMLEINSAAAGVIVDLGWDANALAQGPDERVGVDGRMLAHEWIETSAGFVKVDALDHHDDDFFPGCRDIAWDVAGACVEWNLDPPAAEWLVERYRRLSGDACIRRRLPLYEAAYAAYRVGYAHMAKSSVGDRAEAVRFERLENYYANRLRRFQRGA
jgi:hypothetical protein